MNIFHRVIRKPPRVIAFRALQELRLILMHHAKAWPRLDNAIARWWCDERLHRYATSQQTQPSIIAVNAPEALCIATQHGWYDANCLLTWGQRMRDRQFELLGAPVPLHGDWPWHSDWRCNYTWEPTYFRRYDFYKQHGNRSQDVRVTWELARLAFVLPILQNAALDPEGHWIETAVAIIADWETHNPLAYAVGWYPMEAAMRGINLVFALDMLLALGERRAKVLAPLLRLITTHGVFVWRTLEYTDVRGNHYAANVVALLLCGLALRGWYSEAQQWCDYAIKVLPAEMALQLLPDGVNFEKSIAYHRLVTELFLVAMLAMERAGYPIEPVTKERVHSACLYTATYMRPDGLAPNVGDNDDARVFGYDPVPVRDHRPLLGVAAVAFADAALKTVAGTMPASLPWLWGSQGVTDWWELGPARPPSSRYFQEGGVVVARGGENFLWTDVGEVGLAGRGGHGHNDLLSFDVVLQGQPVVVDPGSYVYTGDPVARDLFRSTAYHNGLRVDGVELAPMSGMWTIGNHAVPHDIEVKTTGSMLTIRASHSGYRRLPDPVLHTREIAFDTQAGTLSCADSLACTDRHIAERYLHLHPAIEVVILDKQARLYTLQESWVMQWDGDAEVRAEKGWVSPGYGVRQVAHILVLTNMVQGNTDLYFTIRPHRCA